MSRLRGTAYWLLLLGVSWWLSLVFLAPYAGENQWAAAPFLYSFFHPICHQLPERSFFWNGNPLAVCHRCFGLYGGFWIGLILLPHLQGFRRHLMRTPRLVLLFFLPLALDLLSENTPWSRFTTGLIAAFPVALFVEEAVNQLTRGDIYPLFILRREE